MVDVRSEAELRELIGAPTAAVAAKARTALGEPHRQWLARSPLCLVATAAADGSCDVSPKGDPPGFTLVLDDTTIAIPDRPGNRRVDTFRNLLANPQVGLLFLVPGRGDTLRINGTARLVRQAPFFDRLTVRGHRPALAMVVTVRETFFHCAKAFMRSELWQPETWDPDALPSRAQIIRSVERPDTALADLERHYGPRYRDGLYG
ncbi:MAG TPA: pyridoxamine 5'-phosphate oxidase family protein [Catenuloplanes sp.]